MEKNDDGSEAVVVEEGEKYEFQDTGFFIEFSDIDDDQDQREITVREIVLSDSDQKRLSSLGDHAWEVTSTMKNGSFEYDLTLPLPMSIDEDQLRVVFVEEEKDLQDREQLEVVNNGDVSFDEKDGEVEVFDLDHFTVFVPTQLNDDENSSFELGQCGNGRDGDITCSGDVWGDDNLNSRESEYFEGESVPYRAVFENFEMEKSILLPSNGIQLEEENM